MDCDNCGLSDFRDDCARGDTICIGCGLLQNWGRCVENSYQEAYTVEGGIFVNTARCRFSRAAFNAVNREKKSQPYKRQTYFNERLSQWQGDEPPIPYDDLEKIVALWHRFAPDAWPDDWRAKPSKDRIGAVLSALDLDLERRKERPRFVRVYYEKWLTIRWHLTGHESWGQHVSQRLIDSLKEYFAKLQTAYDRRYRERFKRHSMISYNFIIRRLLELHGLGYMIEDFPPLKTTAKQRALRLLWKDLCADMGWPYLNGDAQVFPTLITD